MTISSNTYNINLSGEHWFDNRIKYRVSLLLSDILFKKTQRANKSNPDFPYIEEDSLNRPVIFVLIDGTVEKPSFRYDRKSVKEKVGKKLKEDRETIKGMLKEDFNLFKNDTTVKMKKTKPKGKVHIQWDDN